MRLHQNLLLREEARFLHISEPWVLLSAPWLRIFQAISADGTTGGKNSPDWAEKGKEIQNNLLQLVDEDTEAFNRILNAFGLPKKTDEEIALRKSAIQKATKEAALVPFKVMEAALPGFGLISEMVEKGNPSSVTDAAVGALALLTCIRGAFLNVRINASGIDNREFVRDLLEKGQAIETLAISEEEEILRKVDLHILNLTKK